MRARISRPQRENYFRFMEEFAGELSKVHPSACFGYFGSYEDGRIIFGGGDVDGFLILDSGVVTNKDEIRSMSEILAKCLAKNRVRIQFNLLDRETIRDGRFVSYTEDFALFFKEHAKVASGPELFREMRGYLFKSRPLYSASFNFCGPGGVRNDVLHSLDYIEDPEVHFEKKIEKALDNVAKFPKKLLLLVDGRLVVSRDESQRVLEGILSGVDYDSLGKINRLIDNPLELDKVLEDSDRAIRVLYDGLEVMEQMVEAYIIRFPEIGKREVRL